MDLQLERFDHEWKHGNRELAKELAIEYVSAHPGIAEILGTLTLEHVVKMIDGYREVGREEDRIIADMWLLAQFPPQTIIGTLNLGGIADQAAQVAANAWAGSR